MSYTWLTLSTFKIALANRLGDPGKVFWTDAELQAYIVETIRTFGLVGQRYRDRCAFTTQNGINLYDLVEQANPNAITGGTGAGAGNPPALLKYNVLDRDLINTIEYHLIEPVTTNWAIPWTGTDQFTMDDLVRALERRRNLFMLLVYPHLTHSIVAYTIPPSSGRVVLTDSIIAVRRVAWKALDSTYNQLWRTDEWGANSFVSGWANDAGLPRSYSVIMEPRVGIQVIPPSIDTGSLDLITVNAPPSLDQVNGTLLGIPDDHSWIIKWGALADLLGRDSQAFDPVRADYCEKRWEEGVKLALAGSTVYQASVDGVNVIPSPLHGWDSFRSDWQNTVVGANQPLTGLAIAGRNLIAVYPIPDDDIHSVQLDVLRNAPIPANDAALVQIGREDYDYLLDYAFHLAMFKTGTAELKATTPLLERFMRYALMNNEVLSAEARNYTLLRGLTPREFVEKPLREARSNAAD